ncbi:CD48 antigen-like [Centroberyx affinis]|uniref:CD48 antigen-like n=1 Tax=Centroberyx affinis TaxID=166261 RepID=UPI003A5BD512
MLIFLILGLLVCIESPGSSAVSRGFVLNGEDVRLDVQKPDLLRGGVHLFLWSFKSEHTVVTLSSNAEPRVHKNYTGRVEISTEDYSLGLKNLHEADSGVYIAKMFGEIYHRVAEYNVTVQERVSPVNLTVGSVSSSSDSCNLTVTCSAQDSSISSSVTCDNQTCSQEGGERSEVTTSDTSLYVYLSNGSIICNHSNQVSCSKDMKKIAPLCQANQVSGSERVSGISVCLVRTVLLSVGLIIMVSAVISVHLLDRRRKQE